MNKKYRKTVIAGNWKMNLLPTEVKAFTDELRSLMPKSKTCETVLCAPFTHISPLHRALRDSRIAVGAQDISLHESGAYTGEVSGDMLTNLSTRYVIVGHSERREYHNEDNITVGKKAAMVLSHGMIPIICCGETLEQRERGLTMQHISYQIASAMSCIPDDQARRCVIAYEPIWAIGTGKTASPEEAQEVCCYIRRIFREKYGARVARGISVLYGGSMKPSNAVELLSMPDIDGGLIGGASLKPKDFAQIIDAVSQVTGEDKR